MNINFKFCNGQSLKLDFTSEKEFIGTVKSKIIAEINEDNASLLHLVYKGKILDNENKLEDYGMILGDCVYVYKENDILNEEFLKEATTGLMSNGYSQIQANIALRINYNNIFRALDFLSKDYTEAIGKELEMIARMVDNSQFESIRRNISRSEPELRKFVEQIKGSNPALYKAIQNNYAKFLQMLEDPISGELAEGFNPPTVTHKILTKSQHEAIVKLMEFGFDESLCVQAFFACEEDVEGAANFLLSQ